MLLPGKGTSGITTMATGPGSSGAAAGAAVGVIIALLAIIAAVIVVVIVMMRRRKSQRLNEDKLATSNPCYESEFIDTIYQVV